MRRAYIIRPRNAFLAQVSALNIPELTDFQPVPTVVMTEPLAYEEKLEGYRALILRRCKEQYLAEELEFLPLCNAEIQKILIGAQLSLIEVFDSWWEIEEIDTLEIKTNW